MHNVLPDHISLTTNTNYQTTGLLLTARSLKLAAVPLYKLLPRKSIPIRNRIDVHTRTHGSKEHQIALLNAVFA